MPLFYAIPSHAISASASARSYRHPFRGVCPTKCQAIAVDLFFWQVKSSLALVLIVTLLVGVGIGLLAATSSLIAKSWQIARQQQRIKQLEQDLQAKDLKTVAAAAKPAVPAGLLPEASEPKP
ncbi:MAG: LapA family protein [Chloroflexaceae bacterium]|nr:LapA family protein [Chloroflexaceae bacterium]